MPGNTTEQNDSPSLLAYGSFVVQTKREETCDIFDFGSFVTPESCGYEPATEISSSAYDLSSFGEFVSPQPLSPVNMTEPATAAAAPAAGGEVIDSPATGGDFILADPDDLPLEDGQTILESVAGISLADYFGIQPASQTATQPAFQTAPRLDVSLPAEESEAVALEEFLDGGLEAEKATHLIAASSELKEALARDKQALEEEKKALKIRRNQEKREEEQRRKEERRANRIAHPIGVKLIGIISAIIIIALGGVTYLVSYFITQDIRTSAEENNLAINSRTASDSENRIVQTVSAVTMFVDLLKSAGDNETEVKSIENLFFDRNKDIAAVYLPVSRRLFTSSAYFMSRELDVQAAADYIAQEEETIAAARNGSYELENATPFFGRPLLFLCYPVTVRGESRDGVDDGVCVLYSTETMGETFGSGSVNQSFLVNNAGDVLVHGDVAVMKDGDSVRNLVIFQRMQESSQSNSQITYRNEAGNEYIGAFHKLPVGNGAVITLVETAVVLEGIKATTRRNVYITIAILALTVMVVYLFAKSLSVPLKKLTAVVNEINSGNFNTDLFGELEATKSKDEIGVLTKSTQNEREILNTFTKLTNKGVTKAIITKAIDFEPHLKDITIFFSDIRGFTAISDGFKNRFGEKSAGEIISFLNDYMSRMVTCITKTGGTVDKFEGDAIMAAWGVLRNDSLDWENMDELSVTRALKKEEHDAYVREDALSAVTACIAMRYALMKYNKDAAAFTAAHQNEPLAQYKPHIRIGAGLNSGRATVGFMGSYDKMEYTSIGDAVNFASRTEASNKPCGTDILITEDTRALLLPYIRCPENNFTLRPEDEVHEIIIEQIPVEFEVKGKGKQHFYGVVNMPRFDIAAFFSDDINFELDEDCARSVGPYGPKTLREMRALLGIAEPDFGGVNLDAEENKIQVAAP